MAAPPWRPNPRRGASGAWSRLRPVQQDPLESYGLPSKGETRLNDSKAQESYYKTIVDRYMKLCADSGGGNQLDQLFSSLSLESTNDLSFTVPAPAPTAGATSRPAATRTDSNTTVSTARKGNTSTHAASATPSSVASQAKNRESELSLLLSAMRKLREAIVATHRADYFAQRAYIFIIHAALLVRHYESYHPALLYLLKTIHLHTPLPEPEYHEFLGYHILDLACRQHDLLAAYAVRKASGYVDRRVDAVLKALATDNWVRFWELKRAVDGRQAKLLEAAEGEMRLHALKSLGRSYMHADKGYIERCTGTTWEDLVGRYGCGWELKSETDVVVIRKPKVRAG